MQLLTCISIALVAIISLTHCTPFLPGGKTSDFLDIDDPLNLIKDNYGCDAVVQSCGNKGQCCDVHDACYKKHGCTAASWLLLWGNCAACNREVMACVALRNPGKSSCCSAGNCGQPRP